MRGPSVTLLILTALLGLATVSYAHHSFAAVYDGTDRKSTRLNSSH